MRSLTIDQIIDIHVRGTTVDDLRDEIASAGYRSVMSEHLRTGGIRGSGGACSHDQLMVSLADRLPSRYAVGIIDEINAGFHELLAARPVRYQAVISSHISRNTRQSIAAELGLTLNQYKNELSMGREYLAVRFMSMIATPISETA